MFFPQLTQFQYWFIVLFLHTSHNSHKRQRKNETQERTHTGGLGYGVAPEQQIAGLMDMGIGVGIGDGEMEQVSLQEMVRTTADVQLTHPAPVPFLPWFPRRVRPPAALLHWGIRFFSVPGCTSLRCSVPSPSPLWAGECCLEGGDMGRHGCVGWVVIFAMVGPVRRCKAIPGMACFCNGCSSRVYIFQKLSQGGVLLTRTRSVWSAKTV